MIPIQYVGDHSTHCNSVPLLHMQFSDDAGVLGGDVPVLLVVTLGLKQIVQGQLGRADVQLELLDIALYVFGVNAEQHVALMYRLSLFKGGFQDLAADQGGHLVGLDGFDGAGT